MHGARPDRRSAGVRGDRRGRDRQHRLPSLRDGPGRAHQPAADRRRRDGSRLDRVRVVQALGDEARYGNQDTTVRAARAISSADAPLRRRGAADAGGRGRCALERPVGEVQAQNGEVVHGASGRRLGFGALARAAASSRSRPGMRSGSRTPRASATSVWASSSLVDAQDIVTGKAQYGFDTRLPGCSTPSSPGRRPRRQGRAHDADAALKVPGVVQVGPIEAMPEHPVPIRWVASR